MNRAVAMILCTSLLTAISANAVSVRYFLSLEGLSDPNDTDSAAVMPTNIGVDPIIDTNVSGTMHRLYLWALIGPNAADGGVNTDLKGADLAFLTNGDVQIIGGNIWQNNFVPAVTTRWHMNGYPGTFSADATGQFADASPTVSVLEAGITNGQFAALDDQWIGGSLNAAVFGYLDVQGTFGEVNILHQGTGFLQINPANQVFVGWHDQGIGPTLPGPIPHNPNPEATLVPEPGSLAAIGLCTMMLGVRTRRRR